jgi:4-hydroxybenzoate polyprenyltransferase
MLIGITIYTPFLKKITLIKNIYCALTISFCIFYTGLSSVVNINYDNINYKILLITISYIFFGSLNNELLLDIIDIKGDRKNNIMTLPVLFGKEITLIIVNLLLYYNIISNSISLFKIFNNEIIGLIPIFIFVPMIIKVNKIKEQNYSINSINSFLNYTTLSVLLIISYMCVLSYKITFL